MSSRIPRPFYEAWSLSHTRRSICTAIETLKHSVDEVCGSDDESRALTTQLNDAILGHLMHLAQAGHLVLPANTEGLDLDFVSAWSQVIAGGADKHHVLANTFAPALSRQFWQARSEEEADSVHAKVLALMEKGDFGFQDTEVVPCYATGERIKVATRAWKPYLGLFQMGVGWQLLKEGQFAPAGVEHVLLPVPSGELLIHDGFNVGGFQAAIQAIPGYDRLPLLGTSVGRVLLAKTLCMHLGVGSVWVGDVGPDVVPEEGRLLMGFVGEEGPDPDLQQARLKQSVGSISQGNWSTMLVDKQVLINILARTTNHGQARADVDAYIQSEGVLVLHVEPGEHYLYFAADPNVFRKTFAAEEVDFAGFKQPMMVLSPTALTLTTKSTPARKLGM